MYPEQNGECIIMPYREEILKILIFPKKKFQESSFFSKMMWSVQTNINLYRVIGIELEILDQVNSMGVQLC